MGKFKDYPFSNPYDAPDVPPGMSVEDYAEFLDDWLAWSARATRSFDGGYAVWEGQRVYFDVYYKDGSLQVFPGGPPRGSHTVFPHDKIVIEGAQFDGTSITGGRVTYKRIDNKVLIDERGYGSDF